MHQDVDEQLAKILLLRTFMEVQKACKVGDKLANCIDLIQNSDVIINYTCLIVSVKLNQQDGELLHPAVDQYSIVLLSKLC